MPRNYFSEKSQNIIRTEEIDFSIRISNREMEFWDYRKKIYKALQKRKSTKLNDEFDYNKSPIEAFVKAKLERLNKDENSIIFVTNYSEQEGSFLITFSIFVFTTIMNYGQLMDSLDKIKRDFEYFFEDEFSNNTSVDVNYVQKPNRIFEKAEENIIRNITNEIGREFKRLKLIVLTIGIIAGSFSLFAIYKTFEIKPLEQPSANKELIREEVRRELNEIDTKEKINQIHQILTEKKKDTTSEK